jgi:hypothetical protein
MAPKPAAPRQIITAGPTRPALAEIAPQFERATGYRIIAKLVSGPVMKQECE